MDIKEILKYIDCSEAESETLHAMLSYSNGVSVLSLNKTLNIPRGTIYVHLNNLIKKGLVKRGLNEKGNTFYPEEYENIIHIYEEQISKIKMAKIELDRIMSEKKQNIFYKPKFTVYEGNKFYLSVFRDILRSREKNTYWFWPLQEMLKNISSSEFNEFHKERIKRNIWLNVLWTDKQKVDLEKNSLLFSKSEQTSLRKIKILPKELKQDMGYGIYGTKVAFVSSHKENYAFIIDSTELSDALRNQFEYFWKISQKYSN